MERAAINNPVTPYYDTYGEDRPLQPGAAGGPTEQKERKWELGLKWEGEQDGGRDPFGVLLRASLGEFIGMLLFLFYGITVVRFIQDRGDVGETSASTLLIAFAFGLSIFVLVYLMAGVSGAHLNPAISLGLAVGKRITVERLIIYLVAQVLGSVVGAGIATIFLDGTGGAFNALAPGVSTRDAVCGEIICTFLLVIIVFAATDGELVRTTDHTGPLVPLVIGLTVFIGHLVLIPVDGCSINPARSFATALTNARWENHWVFWCGPMLGGILAAVVWECVLRPAQPVGKAQLTLKAGTEAADSSA